MLAAADVLFIVSFMHHILHVVCNKRQNFSSTFEKEFFTHISRIKVLGIVGTVCIVLRILLHIEVTLVLGVDPFHRKESGYP